MQLPYQDAALYQALSELQVIEKNKLDEAYLESQQKKLNLAKILLDRNLIADENLGRVEAELAGVPLARLGEVAIPDDVLRVVPEVMARKQKVIAFGHDAAGWKLAMANPTNTEVRDFIAKKTGEKINVYYATERDLDMAMGFYKKDLQKSFDELLAAQVSEASRGGPAKSEAPIIKIVSLLIEYAFANRASDIHIDPEKKITIVRFRVDGVLHDVLELSPEIQEQVVSKIKVASRLRTDEHLSAQDGKMQAMVENEELDIRVSIVPVVHGEKIVMRLLSSGIRQLSIGDLGMSEVDLQKVKSGFDKPYGMVLVTGPTGSGKTTTIYTILKILNVREINIASIEDPVEYDIEGINQIQVNPKTNLTFANGLRAILRQDPNAIFVGEIRDAETADIAVNSAMTGHLVLSTLHTNDAATTLPRLIDMGVEPFLVASTVNIIVGQRLVRKICEKCRVSQTLTPTEVTRHLPEELVTKVFGTGEIRVYMGKGCPVCHGTGYTGRAGIFEVLEMTPAIKELIMNKADADKIRKEAVTAGMTTMLENGLKKAAAGVTTIDEVIRVTKE